MWDWLSKLEELRSESRPVAVVTVASLQGSAPREIGAKMLVLEGGEFFGTIGGGNLELTALREAQEALADGKSRFVKLPLGPTVGQCCGGVVGILVEVMHRGPRLYVFGAGHVGRAVCQVMAGTPFQVHLIDERREWIESAALPPGLRRHPEGWAAFLKSAPWDGESTYAVILTHDHALDQAILAAVAEKPFRYLGLIGSRTKWRRFRARLRAAGIPADRLERVRCPIGLPLGGKAPKEIAVSLAAQLLTVLYEIPLDSLGRGTLQTDGDAEGADPLERDTLDPSPIALL